jgi:hypothetical protein
LKEEEEEHVAEKPQEEEEEKGVAEKPQEEDANEGGEKGTLSSQPSMRRPLATPPSRSDVAGEVSSGG